MDEQKFDAISKSLANNRSRRNFLRGLAGGLAAALLVSASRLETSANGSAGAGRTGPSRASDSGPEGFVVDYYQAIASHDYQSAYSILGSTLQGKQSYSDFKAGFSDTAFVTVNILGTHALKSNKYRVDVEIIAWHTDGSIHQNSGNYTIGREGGVARIVAASLAEDAAPDAPPLCYASDLDASLAGGAASGHRYGEVSVTNTGDTCVLGGFPKVILLDGNKHKIISGASTLGSYVDAITLAPGDQASTQLDWTMWCGGKITPKISVVVSLPSGFGSVTIPHNFGVPPCVESGASSYLGVTPWS